MPRKGDSIRGILRCCQPLQKWDWDLGALLLCSSWYPCQHNCRLQLLSRATSQTLYLELWQHIYLSSCLVIVKSEHTLQSHYCNFLLTKHLPHALLLYQYYNAIQWCYDNSTFQTFSTAMAFSLHVFHPKKSLHPCTSQLTEGYISGSNSKLLYVPLYSYNSIIFTKQQSISFN